MPDQWSVRLFVALCRRNGFRPFRYPRQRSTTVMVTAPQRLFEEVVWQEFTELHADLSKFLERTTERLIRETIYDDVRDAETAPEPLALG
jgi:hypothetical protein